MPPSPPDVDLPGRGEIPSWVHEVHLGRLVHAFGAGAVQRGQVYAREGRVRELQVNPDGQALSGLVAGDHLYGTLIEPRRHTASRVWTQCTCPVGQNCKHAVALILTAQTLTDDARDGSSPDVAPNRPPGGPTPAPATHTPTPPSPWERILTSAVDGAAGRRDPTARSLGLLVEPTTLGRTRRADDRPAGLTLRPLVPAARPGSWVRTGISWNALVQGHLYPPVDDAQRDAIMALAPRSMPYYSYSGPAATVSSAEVGRGLWHALTECRDAGVTLLTGSRSHPVVLADEPVDVVIDVVRVADGLRVTGRLDLPGVEGEPRLVDSPSHVAAVQSADRLVLARCARTVSSGLAHLLDLPDGLHVPVADEPRFLVGFYPSLRRQARVASSDGSVELPTIAPPRLSLRVRAKPGHRTSVHWDFRYAVGTHTLDVPLVRADDVTSAAMRDPAAEERLLAGLTVLTLVPGLTVPLAGKTRPGVVVDAELQGWSTAVFVREVLPVLRARDDIDIEVSGTLLDYDEADAPPVIAVSTHDRDPTGSGSAAYDWFDLGIEVSVDGRGVPLARLLEALTRGEPRLILDDGTWFGLDSPSLQTLRAIVEEARGLHEQPRDGLRINRFQAGLWEELVSLGVVAHQSERWQRSVGAILALEELPRPQPPAGVRATLRGYQLDGFQWLATLWEHRLGGVLADDMGLGKTLQTLTMVELARERGEVGPHAPVLVVAPTSVVPTWAREAERFTPHLDVVTVTQTERRAATTLAEATAAADVVVTSYALLRIDEDAYLARGWSIVVLDEAQAVKNHRSKSYQVARRLPAELKVAITGTPIENSLMDLWALLSLVAPGLFPDPQRFGEVFRKPIESGASPEQLATLRRRVRPLMLRRTKEAVAPDLPPKIEQVVTVPLNTQHRRIYDTHLQRERQRLLRLLDDVDSNRVAILTGLTRLRQLSLDVHLVDKDAPATVRSSKADALLEQLTEVAAEGHRCLVFSQFTGFLTVVRERLRAAGIKHVYLDGRTRDRARRIAEFTDGDAPVFCISLKAGGSGLTLTAADYVFVLDPWWNPAVEAQAVDRTHRIGQDKTVMVYRLVAADTIEEKVLALQERKRELFDKVVDEGGIMGAPLTAEDLRGLLEH